MKQKIYPWLMVACCCGTSAATIGLGFNCAGLFFAPVAEELGVGRGDVSVFLTLITICSALTGPLIVKISRKVQLRWMLLAGALLMAGTYAVMANVRSLPVVYVCGICAGLANSLTGGIITAMVLGNWFNKKMATATGIAMCFTGIFGAIFNPVFASIIVNSGWRAAYYWMGAIDVLVILPAIIFVRRTPAEAGLEPYGGTGIDPAAAAKTNAGVTAGVSPEKANRYVLLLGLLTSTTFAVSTFGSHLAGFGTSKGLTTQAASLLVSAAMIGNMSSKLLLGLLMDRIGIRKALSVYYVIEAAAFTCMLILTADYMPPLLAATYFFGFAYATGAVGMSPFAKETFGLKLFAEKYALVNMMGSLGSSLVTALVGYTFDWFGSYTPSAVFCICMAGVAFALLQYISFRRVRDAV